MAKRSLMCSVAFLLAANLVLAGQNDKANSGAWSGVIINSGCTVDEAFAQSAKCTKSVPGGKLSLFQIALLGLQKCSSASAVTPI